MGSLSVDVFIWVGIAICLTQSAMFSGLNLAMFGISRLRLEVEASTGNQAAKKILAMRQDSNFLLTTILWGNVAINVLLTLLSDSVMAGVGAFLFSTFAITFFGEITPQAYFSRNALRMGALLSPLLRFYQIILYPVAKPSAMALDLWLGKEGIHYFREHNLRAVIKKHIEADDSDVDRIEGMGALNFLAFDDLLPTQEGEPIHPLSIIKLPIENDLLVYPPYVASATDPFIQKVSASGKKWVVITDQEDQPQLVLNANAFLRAALTSETDVDPNGFTHKPIVVHNERTLLGRVIPRLKVKPERAADDVIDDDLILLWASEKRVITGADILGRLLRGISWRDLGPG